MEILKGDYKFVVKSNMVMVYHYTTYKTPSHGKLWLSCSEGWVLCNDGKYHEIINCGWKQGRIAETLEDIYNCYINQN